MAQASKQQDTGAQPHIERQRPDPTKASAESADHAENASAQPAVDVVAMVSRDKNGNPDQSVGFVVLADEDDDADDQLKDAAWNRAGEAQGAENAPKREKPDLEKRRKEAEEQRDEENRQLRKLNGDPFGS